MPAPPGAGAMMARRRREREEVDGDPVAPCEDACWLCRRPLGRRVERHHPQPKSRGGRATVPVHPICHRTIHARFSNAELARMALEGASPAAHPDMGAFLTWITAKPPDFHAPTRGRR